METIDRNKMAFRRQYLLAPGIKFSDSWHHLNLFEGYTLSVHPDLPITQADRNGFKLVLLGFILDPCQTQKNDQEILDSLCDQSTDVNSLIVSLGDKGGRFVLFIFRGNERIVLNDACGLRQIFYYKEDHGEIWISSHPALISQSLKIESSKEAVDYINSEEYQRKLEAWWPGDSTAFESVDHLLPNHYLDLNSCEVTRFWPYKRLKHVSLKKAVKESSILLKGIMDSAQYRYPLAISLTAGFDSRVLLAASKDIREDLYIFSMQYRKLTPLANDIAIPREIASGLGLEHHLINCPNEISPDFEEVYEINSQGYKTDWINIVQGRFNNIPTDYKIIKGSVASIARCSYWPDGVYPFRVTLRSLVRLSGLGNTSFVAQKLKAWMLDALKSEKWGYKLLDLFAWENEAGNWQGMSHLLFDIAHDEYCPFGNRKLLEIMLGVDSRYRSLPEVKLEQEIIKNLWPELMKFPIHTSWNMGKKKKFYDGELLNLIRWVKYFLSKEKYGRLDE